MMVLILNILGSTAAPLGPPIGGVGGIPFDPQPGKISFVSNIIKIL